MNIRDLKYLVTVAKELHFGKAAELCFVSQPTLSMQLKKMEEELGVILFERTNKQVLLTEVGKKIVAQAKSILQQVDELQQIAKSSLDPFAGIYKLGTIPTIGPYLLPFLVPLLQEYFPQCEFYFYEDKTSVLWQDFLDGQYDAIILATEHHDPHVTSKKLFEEPFYVIAPKKHSLSQKKTISAEELNHEEILLLEEGHCLREQSLAICRGEKTKQNRYQATSLETLRHMVAMGRGVTLLPEMCISVHKNETHFNVIPFKGSIPTRKIYLYWRNSSSRIECTKALAQHIQSTIPLLISEQYARQHC